MKIRRLGVGILLLMVLLAVSGCTRESDPQPRSVPKVEIRETEPQPQRLPKAAITIGDLTISVEIASTPGQRATGMMYRKQLATDEGMLFVFDRDLSLSFYMKNTYAPLSIAFIRSDGTIANIEKMAPLTLSTHDSLSPCRYALEMPQGWFANHGFEAGTRVGIPANVASSAASD